MNIPAYACHYHLKDREPFLTLSDLEKGSEDPVFIEMLKMHGSRPGYRRRFGRNYIDIRHATEEKLLQLFIARGGKPQRKSPYYFILGESYWFRHLNDDHREIRIPLSDFPLDNTSVTFPDSFLTVNRPDKPYYEKVFLLSELPEAVEAFGLPEQDRGLRYDKYWGGDFEKYIEIQLWSDELIESYRQRFRDGRL